MMVVKANKHADGIGGHLSTFASSASAVRDRLQPLLPRQGRRQRRRRRLLPGPRRPRHLRPGVHRGPPHRRRPRPLPPGDRPRRPRPVELPAPPPDARLLGVPDGQHGPRPDLARSTTPASTATCTNRQIDDTSQSRVWCFIGDGECDEPESLGAISLAAREQLDNLIFVVNCNLQRLDGPVRGNGKIIQELEAVFRGAGWNVIKVIWGSKWDELLAQDKDGVLLNKMNTTVDGQFQRYSVESGEYIRDHFFGPDPRLRADGRPPHRRRAAQPAPRRPRLPQAVRRLQGGDREPRQRRADRDPAPRRSRAGRSARASRAATPPTRSRR